MIIERTILSDRINQSIDNNPVTAIMGPRQCGKSTISRLIVKNKHHTIFDLEDPADYTALQESPKITLERLNGLIIIDEIQHLPTLYPILRVLADRPDNNAKFLILGSASGKINKEVSDTLAGRIGFIDMTGFNITETRSDELLKLWFRGGLPRSFLAKDEKTSYQWRNDYVRTFLERDIPQLGINIPAAMLRRFWIMVAHYHGQTWNGAELARSLSVSEPTVRRYLDILTDAFIVRQLVPWHENVGKRQVKSPKIYIRDTGLLHTLLSLEAETITRHPKLGASWEGFVIEQILTIYPDYAAFFWSTYSGAEIDLMMHHEGKTIGIEIKYSDAPTLTKSMIIAINDLSLDKLLVIYPGEKQYALQEKIEVIPANHIGTLLS